MSVLKIDVTLTGIAPILFDRYSGDNNDQLKWEDKVYLTDKETLGMPAINVMSFLSAQNTESAPQRVMGRKWKATAKAALSYCTVTPFIIPFLRNGKEVKREAVQKVCHVSRVKKGQLAVPNQKERPMLDLPWELKLKLLLEETSDLKANTLELLFRDGGRAIGFGTFRGVFGKFEVTQWDISK